MSPLHFNRDATWRVYESWQRCDTCLTHAYRATGRPESGGPRRCFRSQPCSCGTVQIDGPEVEGCEKPWERDEDSGSGQ